MIFPNYYETTLEQWVSNRYRASRILQPEDMDLDRISEVFLVDLRYDQCLPFSDNEERVIFLNKRDPHPIARMVYFHELCHVLRHAGDQRRMNKLFRDGQEADAKAFLLYASMPFFMISQLDIPENQKGATYYLAKLFSVPPKLAKQRLLQIQRRELQSTLMLSRLPIAGDEPVNVPTETQIYAYYDPAGNLECPSQLILHIDEQTLHTCDVLQFSLDDSLAHIDESELHVFAACLPVLSDDLDYKDGKISLKLRHLTNRYNYASQSFVIQMKELKTVMEFNGAYCK
ncbi:ImmA/IrrE family metallo-endopeptidase [Paenibacillus sp. F411]|uniref:ImmA/IrrE family metallo-endopeptidase n=1 Tax=Paenibacillus sp. F411 TaxID=2820239 RepID=UPI001AAFA9EF|nr:ImmA/IrrE family metallo-endopeptidase [Paenibacillus sp. F411]MBO2942768.1 ImmA/IrrE family metallo-endopeptidase [Paenibacillus sp. F411]